MLETPILELSKDCEKHGYGRKKWWADRLQVPALTLSHWLVGRQSPNLKNLLKIQTLLKQTVLDSRLNQWKEYLWKVYYQRIDLDPDLLSLIIGEIVSAPRVDQRTLALMVYLTKKYRLKFSMPEDSSLQNRLGWLLEMAHQPSSFIPQKIKNKEWVGEPMHTKAGEKYIQSLQTVLGRKWKVYDCDISSTLESFI